MKSIEYRERHGHVRLLTFTRLVQNNHWRYEKAKISIIIIKKKKKIQICSKKSLIIQ